VIGAVLKIENSLLAAVPRKAYRRLLAGLEPVTLTFGEVLYEPGETIRHVYFPGASLVSLLTLADGHLALEVGLIGREGMSAFRWCSDTASRRFALWCRVAGRLCGWGQRASAMNSGPACRCSASCIATSTR
jgi:hypothetical protein